MINLNEKVALITGGAGFVGNAVVHRFLELGACVALGDIEIGKFQIPPNIAGGRLDLSVVDVTIRASVDEWVANTIRRFGKIDILANVAGGPRNRLGLVSNLSDGDWEEVLDSNLRGSFNCIRAVTPHMTNRRSGRIVNVSSTSKDGVPWFRQIGQSHYSAANAGLVGLTRSLAYELGLFNVCINCVVPGPIETPKSIRQFNEFEADPKIQVSPKRLIPLGRLGTPDDVANAIAFLASDAASYITGASLYVSGGLQ